MQIDMVCSSGMMAVMNAATVIKACEADLVLAGGTESMSNTGVQTCALPIWGYKLLLGSPEGLMDLMLNDGLTDPMSGEAMGTQTERLAAEHGITRRDLDAIAAHSQQRSAEASEKGWFDDEIVPVEIKSRKGPVTLNRDEGIRSDTTLESLAGLRPAFQKDGVLTAGNSSQISDGASALLVASEAAVERLGLTPMARILAGGWSAGESWRFPEAPIPAIESVLKKTKMEIGDFDLFENNEAFAINSILLNRMLKVPYDKLNVQIGRASCRERVEVAGEVEREQTLQKAGG